VSETDAFKLLEAGVLLAAGVAFGWWQLRDVAKARQASRAAQAMTAKEPGPAAEQATPGPANDAATQHSEASAGPHRNT
jgi:predicted negative regulator of RcsB-dependent stress response